MFSLHPATIYYNLQRIADENGVSRDSLLQVVRTPTEKRYEYEAKQIKVDVEELKAGFK